MTLAFGLALPRRSYIQLWLFLQVFLHKSLNTIFRRSQQT